MADLPIMRLYWQSLLSDTTHMSDAEFGAYVRILGAIWLHGGKYPHDSERLRKVAGTSPRRWRKIERVVLEPLTISGGMVSQKRLTTVLLETREQRAKMAARGRAGAARRWSQFGPNVRPFRPPK